MKMKSSIERITLSKIRFMFFALLISVAIISCQQKDTSADEMTLKTAVIPELTLNFPDKVNAGEDFNIVFSSNCGKIMIERGYIHGDPIGEPGTGYEKIYTGLTCETPDLQWESIVEKGFQECTGGTVTENWDEAGTYVYRAKLNHNAYLRSSCPDCSTFTGNKFECFMVTVGEGSRGTFTDVRDGKTYETIKIGGQVWMTENLAYLPSVSPSSLSSETAPYYYVYDYQGTDVAAAKQHTNYTTYGVLYNWPAAMAACPAGWHLPSDAEWKELEISLGMTQAEADEIGLRGTNQGTQMKTTSGWLGYGNGTNTSGFSALPGGYRNLNGGEFNNIDYTAYWWSSAEQSGSGAWYRYIDHSYTVVLRFSADKMFGFSVRCVRY